MFEPSDQADELEDSAGVDEDLDLALLFGGADQEGAAEKESRCGRTKRKSVRPSAADRGVECQYLPPEPQAGNIEYKLKLCGKGEGRFQQLVTQMRWRLDEGGGTAVYMLGVTDSGKMVGVPHNDLKASMVTIKRMAQANKAEVSMEKEWEGPGGHGAKVLVQTLPDANPWRDVRVAFIGDAQSGKSSLASVLSCMELDDGRGRARLELFRHGHEIRSGRTSSIGSATLHFSESGEFIPPKESRQQFNAKYKCGPARVITLFDLAGDPKYYKTALTGLMGRELDVVVLIVSAVTGVGVVAQELLGVTSALGIPIVAAITKIDLCTEEILQRTIGQVTEVAQQVGFDEIDLVTSMPEIRRLVEDFHHSRQLPLFCTSSVNGADIPLLRSALTSIATAVVDEVDSSGCLKPLYLQVLEVFSVADAGPIIGGVVRQGSPKIDQTFSIGPFEDGRFEKVVVKSTRRDGVPCYDVRQGQSVTLEIAGATVSDLRQGMVLVEPGYESACTNFVATVRLVPPAKDILPVHALQVVVVIGAMKQAAILRTESPITEQGDSTAYFTLESRPEHIRVGDKVVFKIKRGCTGFGQVLRA